MIANKCTWMPIHLFYTHCFSKAILSSFLDDTIIPIFRHMMIFTNFPYLHFLKKRSCSSTFFLFLSATLLRSLYRTFGVKQVLAMRWKTKFSISTNDKQPDKYSCIIITIYVLLHILFIFIFMPNKIDRKKYKSLTYTLKKTLPFYEKLC